MKSKWAGFAVIVTVATTLCLCGNLLVARGRAQDAGKPTEGPEFTEFMTSYWEAQEVQFWIFFGALFVFAVIWFGPTSGRPVPTPASTARSVAPPAALQPPGQRTCARCGLTWVSTYGQMKDSGFLDSGIFAGPPAGLFNSANLLGLTCTKCGKSFCRDHLSQQIPEKLPGGKCPSCRGKLFIA